MFQRTGYTYLEAFPGTVVTPVGRVGVGVAAAVAGLTGIAHLQRVAVVTVGTSGNFGRDKKRECNCFPIDFLAYLSQCDPAYPLGQASHTYSSGAMEYLSNLLSANAASSTAAQVGLKLFWKAIHVY